MIQWIRWLFKPFFGSQDFILKNIWSNSCNLLRYSNGTVLSMMINLSGLSQSPQGFSLPLHKKTKKLDSYKFSSTLVRFRNFPDFLIKSDSKLSPKIFFNRRYFLSQNFLLVVVWELFFFSFTVLVYCERIIRI